VSQFAKQLLRDVHLSEQHILKMLPLLSIRSYDTGAIIWDKGRPVLAWNCVMTGFVAAAEPMARGGMIPLQVHGPHAWFGEQALLGGQVSQVDYVCLTPVELIGMRQSCLENALCEEPEFMRFMLQLLARRVGQHTELQLLLRLGGMPLRVVMGLAQFVVNQPQSFTAQFKPHPEDAVDISLSQDQIAAVCGVSRTLFSECLQRLARGGWVKLRYGGMSLQSAAAWRLFARQWQQRQSSVRRTSMNELLNELSQARVASLSPVALP
jgi:CRP/FNR family cyclic AMP-dependent transcriptional regulator